MPQCHVLSQCQKRINKRDTAVLQLYSTPKWSAALSGGVHSKIVIFRYLRARRTQGCTTTGGVLYRVNHYFQCGIRCCLVMRGLIHLKAYVLWSCSVADEKGEAGSGLKSRNQHVQSQRIKYSSLLSGHTKVWRCSYPIQHHALKRPPSRVCKNKKSLSQGRLKVVGWVIQSQNMLFNMKNVCQQALFLKSMYMFYRKMEMGAHLTH